MPGWKSIALILGITNITIKFFNFSSRYSLITDYFLYLWSSWKLSLGCLYNPKNTDVPFVNIACKKGKINKLN